MRDYIVSDRTSHILDIYLKLDDILEDAQDVIESSETLDNTDIDSYMQDFSESIFKAKETILKKFVPDLVFARLTNVENTDCENTLI